MTKCQIRNWIDVEKQMIEICELFESWRPVWSVIGNARRLKFGSQWELLYKVQFDGPVNFFEFIAESRRFDKRESI